MQFNREKLKEAILYIASKCPPETLGAVKLHKIFYFADMLRYAETGAPLFGATYRKRKNGPTCEQLLSAFNEMQKTGDLEVSKVDYFGYQKTQFKSRRSADMSRFNVEETDLLDEIIDFVCKNHTAKTISEFSHQLPWELVEFGEKIDYNSVFLLFPDEPSEEAKEWATREANRIEVQRPKADALGFRSGSDFRSRILESFGG